MMSKITYLIMSYLALIISILLQPAYAIPPPDALMSLWQSALQFLGMISVVLAGAALTLKQFFAQYLVGWKRYAALSAVLISTTGVGIWWFSTSNPNTVVQAGGTPKTSSSEIPLTPQTITKSTPSSALVLPHGEYLALSEILKRDHDDYVRNWKIKTYQEMQAEAQLARKLAGLKPLEFKTIESFTPSQLATFLKMQRQQFYMLDVREDYEQAQFSITPEARARYGDLIHDIIPTQLPRNKLIIVLCHSGIRGYIAANALLKKGYTNVAFLQGGLAAWSDAKFPVTGNANYSLKPKSLTVLSLSQFKKLTDGSFKVQIDTTAPLVKTLKNLQYFPYETASNPMLKQLLQQAGNKPIALVCNSYAGCFHGLNMSYLIKQAGKNYIGIYDASGQWLIP